MTTTRSIRAAVLRFAHEHDLLRPGPLLVAVSGGTDSTALLLLLTDLAPKLGLVLHVAHFDHRTRPRAAAADAAFVASLADRCGAPIRIGRADRAAKSEDDGRELRYAFLRRAARETGALAIATGHTRDDQAETVLLHAVRGSGLAGIAGMRPRRDDIVRPLLGIGRAETALICHEAGVAPREDPTNASLAFARNRVRHRVLPELERINPEARAALARLADAAAAVSAATRARAERALDGARSGAGIALDRLPPEVRDDALAIAWERHSGRPLNARQRKALGHLARDRAGSAALDLPGGRVRREYALIRFDAPAPAAGADIARLIVGQPVEWSGWTIMLSDAPQAPADMPLQAPAPAAGALLVRSRRPGDRLADPLRMKVQDLFTDAKVPARLRPTHPLVTTETGEVWWVVGLKHAYRGSGGERRLFARPPVEQFWSSPRYTGSIEGDEA
ncbi:MAG TPA: tRNA lysidine(34) synthetase TilS [Candidatus Limnocylindria bacterium]|nr:tRNA lysidine(34) synthetase TilS [Candidatus Limnocylindria bacterium]